VPVGVALVWSRRPRWQSRRGYGLSLLLTPRVNRITNIAVSLLYTATILGSCIGETWAYYFIGSAVETVLLLAIARTAWKWPRR